MVSIGKHPVRKVFTPFSTQWSSADPVNFSATNPSTKNGFFSLIGRSAMHRVSERGTDVRRIFHRSTDTTTTTGIYSDKKSLESVNCILMALDFFVNLMHMDAV
jgi:hypothetical protein